MVTTKLKVHENGDLELPPRPRRRLRLKSRFTQGRDVPSLMIPEELGFSKLIA